MLVDVQAVIEDVPRLIEDHLDEGDLLEGLLAEDEVLIEALVVLVLVVGDPDPVVLNHAAFVNHFGILVNVQNNLVNVWKNMCITTKTALV